MLNINNNAIGMMAPIRTVRFYDIKIPKDKSCFNLFIIAPVTATIILPHIF